MSVRQPSETVSAHLDSLYAAFDGFDVTQTTVSVAPEEFAAVEERGDVAEVRARIESEEGLLAVPEDGEWVRPGGVVEGEDPLPEAAERLVGGQTGVDCSLEELRRVSLVSLQCEASGDQVWELKALFAGTAESGTLDDGAVWRESLPDLPSAF